jgi:hypothetical protein
MKFSHPVVLLLGAGATRGGLYKRPIPPPVDADFFELAGQIKGHGTPELAGKVLKDVWNLYQRVAGFGLEDYYRDIETRESISKFAKTANQPMDWPKRKKNLEELIRRVIIHSTCKHDEQKHLQPLPSAPHRQMLGRLEPGDVILTFNYDTLIEDSFGRKSMWTPRGGYGDKVYGVTSAWCRRWFSARPKITTHQKSKIRLLKLHGSINWITYKTGQVKIKERPFVVRSGRFEKVSILPPGWNKKVSVLPYRLLWREARLKLEQCETLVVIGYSLPETDLLARALFSEVVRSRAARKNYLKQLHLADPIDSVKQKFINLFVPTMNAKSKIFRYKDINEFAATNAKK